MTPPGPISDVKEIFKFYLKKNISQKEYIHFCYLEKKWYKFAKYIDIKYDLKKLSWSYWCKWYLLYHKKKNVRKS